ncbi:MAG: DsrE/DsrF/DrsH-like family protein [Peptococcaceae bacterium]
MTDLKNGGKYGETYDKLILAPGAMPIKPEIPGIDGENIFTLRNIPDTFAIKDFVDHKKPQRAVVVGGGFIGLEIAENLHEKGIDVTLIEKANQVIGPLDYEMAALVHGHLKDKGMEFYLEDGLKAVQHYEKYSVVELESGEKVITDLIILGIGVRPEISLAEKAGLEPGERGGIKVDKHLRTSDPDIYAVGDAIEVADYINGKPALIPLAGPANKQGRIAAGNICGLTEEYEGTQGTSVLKVFEMTVASTGNNEKVLKRSAVPYEKSYTHSASHAGYYPGAMPISIKLIFDPGNGRILGAQAVGYEGVEKRIDVLATAIRAGMTVYDLEKLELSYAPPYSSAKDPVNMAGYVAANILKKACAVIHWDEIAEREAKGSMLLDVRTKEEFDLGSLKGAVNIPLDELRSRLMEIPRDKEVIIYCQVGLRGYLAYRILVQKGFKNIRNLSGGYNTYYPVMQKQSNKHIYDYGKIANSDLIHAAVLQEKCTADVSINACGLQCPGPIIQVYKAVGQMKPGQVLEIAASDPGFARDLASWCERTGNQLLKIVKGSKQVKAYIKKNRGEDLEKVNDTLSGGTDKTLVVFSGDLDKAIASFIIANGAAAMGRKVTMFFTFWGLNILRKNQKVSVKKDVLAAVFGRMMPRGSKKLGLSKMNMGGLGAKMIRYIMNKKNVATLEELILQAKAQGINMVACSMSMDVMGIKAEELIEGVEIGGVAAYLGAAEKADTNLFI